MKKMFETIFVLGLVLTGIVCVVACSDKLDVQQVYEFDMATLPVLNRNGRGSGNSLRAGEGRNVCGNEVFYPLLPTGRQGAVTLGKRDGSSPE